MNSIVEEALRIKEEDDANLALHYLIGAYTWLDNNRNVGSPDSLLATKVEKFMRNVLIKIDVANKPVFVYDGRFSDTLWSLFDKVEGEL